MNTFTIFLFLIVVVALLLVLVIMVQNPKGGGLSSSFGGSAQMGGVQNTTDFLTKSTWGLAILLTALILLSNVSIMGGKGSGEAKVLDEEIEIQNEVPSEINVEAIKEEAAE